MTRIALLLILLITSFSGLKAQDKEILSIFRIGYSEINGDDLSQAAYDCSMAVIFYKQNGKLGISRTCLDGGTNIDGYYESDKTVTLMESAEEEKWMLSFDFTWRVEKGKINGETIDLEGAPAKALIALLKERDEPLYLFFKTFKEGEWYPNMAIEAKLVQGSEAWDNMIFNWQQHAERRDPPE